MFRLRTLLLLAALLCVSCFANAQTNDFPSVPPPDAPPSTVKPATLLRETLPNGLRVVIQENHRVPEIEIKMGVRAGLVSDPIDNPYMTHLAVQMIEQGSEKYTPEKRSKAALAIGGDLSINLLRDYVDVSASCLSGNFDKMLNLMSDMIRNPKMDREYMTYFTAGVVEAVKRKQVPPSTDESKGRQAYAIRYPTDETVKKLDRDHLVEFLDNYYCPNNSILVICGDLNAAETMKQIKTTLGAWKRGETPPLPKFVPEVIEPFYYIYIQDDPHSIETHIQMVINVPGLEDKDRIALQLANVIMGESLDSRLFRSVREKFGYVYGINSIVQFEQYATVFAVVTECRVAVTAKTVKQTEIEVAKLRDEPVGEEELTEAKHFLAHKYILAQQSQAETLGELFQVEFYKRPADYFRKLQGKINALTAADVQTAAKKYMFPNGSAQIAITGPKERIVDRLMNANIGIVVNPDSQ
jgi:zinc protease